MRRVLSFLPPGVRKERGPRLSEGQISQEAASCLKDCRLSSVSFQVIITSLSIETLRMNLQLPSDG